MQNLKNILYSIDGKGYKSYKKITGVYQFTHFSLSIDHVQGDPFAIPSRISIQVPTSKAGFPISTWTNKNNNPVRRIALEDYLGRILKKNIQALCKGQRGSGGSGIISIEINGQKTLLRNAILINQNIIEARLVIGLPADDRRVAGQQAQEMLFNELPAIIEQSLFYQNLSTQELINYVNSAEDQDELRNQLKNNNLVAFIANGSLLPRQSGISDKPMNGEVISFISPVSLEVEITLPNAGKIMGMGIPQGITLIVGGGFHGKSTLLQAIEHGVYNHIPNNPNSLSGNTIRALYEDKSGILWIGTYGAGLTKFDPQKNTFTRYLHNPKNPQSLKHNDIRSIYEDKSGILWISTLKGGLNKLNRKTGQFTHYIHNPNNPKSIASNDVRQVLEDSTGTLWVISGLSGVSIFDRKSETFINYSYEPGDPNSIGFNNVYNILEDHSGVLFFFSVSGKVDKYDRKSQRFKIYQNNPHNKNSLSTSSILHLYEDNNGTMWFGGFKEGGLNRYDRKTGKYTRYASNANDPGSLKYSYPTEFLEDKNGIFWISTSDVSTATLSIFDRELGKVIKRYEHDPNNPDSLPQSLFNFSMINDKEDTNILWIGSYGSG